MASRCIDRDNRERIKPMELLVLGLCRTGTRSMCEALKLLGYTPYHMDEAAKNPQIDLVEFCEAMEAECNGIGDPFGVKEWDKLLGRYDAVTDLPCAYFVDGLTTAYPDAKVILTTREPRKWQRSVLETIWAVSKDWRFKLLSFFGDKRISAVSRFLTIFLDNFCGGKPGKQLRQAFLDHNKRVLEIKDRELLEYSVEDGWEPLCKFLGKSIPDVEFPRVNESKDFKKAANMRLRLGLGLFTLKHVMPLAVIGAALWFYKK